MADSVYCYPDSDVLINKLGIQEQEKLYIFERKLTMLRVLEIIDKPIKGKFDFAHLQAIHRYIFQDVYEWAGKIRKVDIAKGNMFCNVLFIETQAEEMLKASQASSLCDYEAMEELFGKCVHEIK